MRHPGIPLRTLFQVDRHSERGDTSPHEAHAPVPAISLAA